MDRNTVEIRNSYASTTLCCTLYTEPTAKKLLRSIAHWIHYSQWLVFLSNVVDFIQFNPQSYLTNLLWIETIDEPEVDHQCEPQKRTRMVQCCSQRKVTARVFIAWIWYLWCRSNICSVQRYRISNSILLAICKPIMLARKLPNFVVIVTMNQKLLAPLNSLISFEFLLNTITFSYILE